MRPSPESTRELLEQTAWLERLARRLVSDPGLAQDAVQDTLVAAAERRTPGPLSRGWLARVLRNGLRQGLRSRGRRSDHEARATSDPAPVASTYDTVARLEVQRLVVEAVQALEEPYRTTLALRFLEDLPPREVARRMGTPVKTVKTRLERGLDQLRRRLDTDTGGRERWLAALAPLGSPLWRTGLPLTISGALTMGMGWKVAGGAVLVTAVWLGLRSDEVPQTPPSVRAPEVVASKPEVVEATTPEPAQALRQELGMDPLVQEATESPQEEAAELAVAPVTFRGFVRDVEGRPLGGLEVRLLERMTEAPLGNEGEVTVSGADGGFELPVADRRGRLVARGRGWATLDEGVYPGGTPPEAPVVVVGPERRYGGRVLDEVDQPVANANLEIRLPGPVAQRLRGGALAGVAPIQVRTTDAEGRFLFPFVGHVDGLELSASCSGYESSTRELPVASDEQLELRLERPRGEPQALAGHVVDQEGRAVADALVEANGQTARTDDRGAFVLEDQGDATRIRAVAQGLLPATLDLAGLDPSERRDLRLVFGGPALTLEGRVVDAAGAPVPGALVWTFDGERLGTVQHRMGNVDFAFSRDIEEVLGGGGGRRVTTDEHGAFRFHGLQDRDYDLEVLDPLTLTHARRTGVPAGTRGTRFVLERTEPLASVAGQVVDGAGRPVPGATVDVRRSVRDRAGKWRTQDAPPTSRQTTDAEGRFRFESLALQGTSLVVDGDAQPHEVVQPLAETDDLERLLIHVPGTAHLRIVLEDPTLADGIEVRDGDDQTLLLRMSLGSIVVASYSVSLENGTSGLVDTADTARTLVLFAGGLEVQRRPIRLATGEVTEVRF